MQILLPLHIFFMALSAVLIVSAVIIAHGRKQGWLKKHKTLALSGVLSALIAFAIIFTFKIVMQFPHLHSLHAIAGIVTLLFLVVTPFLGLSMAKGPKLFRPLHKLCGRITSVAILVTALMGLLRFLQLTKS